MSAQNINTPLNPRLEIHGKGSETLRSLLTFSALATGLNLSDETPISVYLDSDHLLPLIPRRGNLRRVILNLEDIPLARFSELLLTPVEWFSLRPPSKTLGALFETYYGSYFDPNDRTIHYLNDSCHEVYVISHSDVMSPNDLRMITAGVTLLRSLNQSFQVTQNWLHQIDQIQLREKPTLREYSQSI